jgi:hypothetical protein
VFFQSQTQFGENAADISFGFGGKGFGAKLEYPSFRMRRHLGTVSKKRNLVDTGKTLQPHGHYPQK